MTDTVKTINARNYKSISGTFEVYGTAEPPFGQDPSISILVEPKEGKEFLLPMNLECARDLARMLLATVLRIAPGVALEPVLEHNPRLREKLATEGLEYEDIRAALPFL